MLVDRPESPTSPLVPSGEFTVDAMNRARGSRFRAPLSPGTFPYTLLLLIWMLLKCY